MFIYKPSPVKYFGCKVVTWGDPSCGGDSRALQEQLQGKKLCASFPGSSMTCLDKLRTVIKDPRHRSGCCGGSSTSSRSISQEKEEQEEGFRGSGSGVSCQWLQGCMCEGDAKGTGLSL